jgi:hypothetical protein
MCTCVGKIEGIHVTNTLFLTLKCQNIVIWKILNIAFIGLWKMDFEKNENVHMCRKNWNKSIIQKLTKSLRLSFKYTQVQWDPSSLINHISWNYGTFAILVKNIISF